MFAHSENVRLTEFTAQPTAQLKQQKILALESMRLSLQQFNALVLGAVYDWINLFVRLEIVPN